MAYTGPQYQTVDEVWIACGNGDDPPSDADARRMQRQIRIASRAVDRKCGRSFMHVASVTRHYTAVPLPDLQIPDAATITSVTVHTTSVPEDAINGYVKLPLDSTEADPLTTALRLMVDGVPTNWDQHPAVLTDGPTKAITVVLEAGPSEPPPEVVEVTEAVSVRLWQRRINQHGSESGYGGFTEKVPVGSLVDAYADVLEELIRPLNLRAPLIWEQV